MIKLSYDQIAARIKEKSGVSDEEIEKRVSEKLSLLSGLISREGAGYIVANELGVKLLEQTSGRLQIKNILLGMRDVEVVGKVLRVYEMREFTSADRKGKVASVIIGDETGTVRVTLWGNQADVAAKIKLGDIFKVLGGYVRGRDDKVEVHVNERAQCIINPPGEIVQSVTMPAVQNARKQIKELTPADTAAEILGTVMQVYEPRFYEVCPDCGKRIRISEQGYVCGAHGIVAPAFSYVINALIEDGSDSVRVVFFRNAAEKFLNAEPQKILELKENPAKFLELRDSVVGSFIKVAGRVSKNDMFDRIEFVASSVTLNPNPDEEIARLREMPG